MEIGGIRRRRSRYAPEWTRREIGMVLAGYLLAGLMGAACFFFPLFQTAVTTAASSGTLPNPNPVAVSSAPFTVLLLGSDDDSKFQSDRVLTQSMILVRVVPETKSVTMLSIPRDLWVPLPNGSKGKIDAAYSEGGAHSAIQAVESNFHVKVDDYVWVGLQGLVNVINKLGGVDVNVSNPVMDDFYPADIGTTNPYGYYRVAVLPGPQHLDGIHALQYVRSRHGDLREDFGRSFRQQQVLLALKAQAGHLNAASLPEIASALNGEVKTSMGLDRIRQLLPLVNQIGGPNVKQIVLLPPYTAEGMIGDQSVVLPNWDQILPLVRQTFP
ncbi:MAG TPA: LCP family protein [Candidatus Dormibacteraeota bacterium]